MLLRVIMNDAENRLGMRYELSCSAAQATLASPAVRRVAREHGIDLASVRGSGPDGRISKGSAADPPLQMYRTNSFPVYRGSWLIDPIWCSRRCHATGPESERPLCFSSGTCRKHPWAWDGSRNPNPDACCHSFLHKSAQQHCSANTVSGSGAPCHSAQVPLLWRCRVEVTKTTSCTQ